MASVNLRFAFGFTIDPLVGFLAWLLVIFFFNAIKLGLSINYQTDGPSFKAFIHLFLHISSFPTKNPTQTPENTELVKSNLSISRGPSAPDISWIYVK